MENAVELRISVHGDDHGQCLEALTLFKCECPFSQWLWLQSVLGQWQLWFAPLLGCSKGTSSLFQPLNSMTQTTRFHLLSQGPPSGYTGPVHRLFSALLLQKKNMCTLIKVLGFDDKKGLAFLPAQCRQVRDSWYTYADNGESFVPLKTNKSDISRSCSCSEKHQART